MATSSSKKSDPAYEYGFLPDEKNKTRIGCKFCQSIFNGGITRLKEHLAGRRGNVKSCEKASEDARIKCATMLDEIKRQKDLKIEAANALRAQVNLRSNGEQSDSDGETVQVPSSKASGTSQGSVRIGPIDSFCRLSIEEAVKLKKGKKVQSVINKKQKEELRESVCDYIGQWFYEAAVAHNAAKLPSFLLMIEAIGDYGRGLKVPSPYELSGPILQRRKKKIEESLKSHRQTWSITGCSILTDAWTDKKGRGIMNLVVHSAQGSFFLKSVDASALKKDGSYIFDLVDRCVEEIGVKNVIQIVTDSARANEAAASLLKVKRPSIFWTACAAHTIDLMLEDIGRLPKVKAAIEKGKIITVFLYTHQRGLEAMRRCLGKDLVRSGITRFATSYLNLKSLNDNKAELKTLFHSQEFAEMGYIGKPKAKGQPSFDIVISERFWKDVSYAIKLFEPLVHVLRLVDSETPAMGLIWGALDDAKKLISLQFDGEEKHYKEVWDIIDKRWNAKLKSPLHKAGHYLNPYYYYENRENIDRSGEFRGGLITCIGKMCDEEEQDRIANELNAYERGIGSFGSEMAIRHRKRKGDPVNWWANHGSDTPLLRNLAMRVLSLTCSSSACERNWSVFEQVNSKKRAKMLHSRMSDLVFVKFNSKLKQKKEDTNRDPIEIPHVDVLNDKNNEWVGNVPSDEEDNSEQNGNGEDTQENVSTQPRSCTRKRVMNDPTSSRHAKKTKKLINTGELMSASSSEEEDEQLDLPSSGDEDDHEEDQESSSS